MVGDLEVVAALLRELMGDKYRSGVVVDGFPRTKVQADIVRQLYDTMMSQYRQVSMATSTLRGLRGRGICGLQLPLGLDWSGMVLKCRGSVVKKAFSEFQCWCHGAMDDGTSSCPLFTAEPDHASATPLPDRCPLRRADGVGLPPAQERQAGPGSQREGMHIIPWQGLYVICTIGIAWVAGDMVCHVFSGCMADSLRFTAGEGNGGGRIGARARHRL
jgi:hypothetical protein